MSVSQRERHFAITARAEGGSAVLYLSGDLDLAVAHQLAAAARTAIDAPATRGVVIDLEAVTFIDTTGLNVLVQTRQVVVHAGKEFALRNLAAPTQRLFTLTGLDFMLTPAPVREN